MSRIASFLSALRPCRAWARVSKPAIPVINHRWIITTASTPSDVTFERTTKMTEVVSSMTGDEWLFLNEIHRADAATNAQTISALQNTIWQKIKDAPSDHDHQLRTLIKKTIKEITKEAESELNKDGAEENLGPWRITCDVEFREESKQQDAVELVHI